MLIWFNWISLADSVYCQNSLKLQICTGLQVVKQSDILNKIE